MYIWETELNSFPFGWQKTIDRFKQEKMDILSDCNPTEYKKLLVINFRKLSEEARRLVKKTDIDIHRLFTLDYLLWGIVWDYTRSDNVEITDKTNHTYVNTFELETFADEMTMLLAYEDYGDYFWGDNILNINGAEQKVDKIMAFDFHRKGGVELGTCGIKLGEHKAGYLHD